MARIQSFAQDLKLATAGLAPNVIAQELANFARAELAARIRSGEASPRYDRFVNGVAGADENTVVPPGPIVYDFHWWNEVLEYAVETLQERSPVRSGRFRRSWFVMVNNQPVVDYSQIPIGAEVIVTNDQPYSRKIEVGYMQMSVPHGVAEDSMAKIKRRFGNVVEIRKAMIKLPNGYILKGVFRRGIRPQSRTNLRRDTMAGAEMTYPALIFKMRA